MKILGIGVDIIENTRIKKSIKNNAFLKRIFTTSEILEAKKIKYKTFNVAASKPIKLNKVIFLLNQKIKSKSKIVYLTKKNQSYLISTNKLKKSFLFHLKLKNY